MGLGDYLAQFPFNGRVGFSDPINHVYAYYDSEGNLIEDKRGGKILPRACQSIGESYQALPIIRIRSKYRRGTGSDLQISTDELPSFPGKRIDGPKLSQLLPNSQTSSNLALTPHVMLRFFLGSSRRPKINSLPPRPQPLPLRRVRST